MVEKRPARIWWRKHRSAEDKLMALSLITEGPTGLFDVFLYSPGPNGMRRIAEETVAGSPADVQQKADGLAREMLRHDCADCDGWV